MNEREREALARAIVAGVMEGMRKVPEEENPLNAFHPTDAAREKVVRRIMEARKQRLIGAVLEELKAAGLTRKGR